MAIGILVDDAIVVIENVERIMREEKLPPYEATVKAMSQITSRDHRHHAGAVAVFVPMAFFPGTTGGIYRQFSVTLAISIAFSALLALTLTPALCATLLKPHDGARIAAAAQSRQRRVDALLRRLQRLVRAHAPAATKALVGQILLAAAALPRACSRARRLITLVLFTRLPGSFLPGEDQGSVITVVQAPPGATTRAHQHRRSSR